MKIAMVAEIDISSPGGPSHHLIGVAEAFSKLGHDVTVFVPKKSKLNEEVPFKIVYVPTINRYKMTRPVYTFLVFFYLFFFLITRKCNLIYTRSSYYTIVSPILAFLFRIKHISEINGFFQHDLLLNNRSSIIRCIVNIIESFSYIMSDLIITVTDQIRVNLIKTFSQDPKIVKTINNASRDYGPPLSVSDARKLLHIQHDDMLINYSGTLDSWQGLDNLINAMPEILKIHPNTKLLITGDGPVLSELISLKEELSLEDNVTFLGALQFSEAIIHIQASNVCVIPSGIESVNNLGRSATKLYTYMSCGRPIVAANVPGLDLVGKENIGYNYPPGNSQELANCVIKLLADPKKNAKISKISREVFLKHYTWDHVAQKTLYYLKEMENVKRI